MCFDDDGSALFEPSFVVADLLHHAPETAIMGAIHKSSAIATAGAGKRYIELRFLMVLVGAFVSGFMSHHDVPRAFQTLSGFAETLSPEQAGHKCFECGHQVTTSISIISKCTRVSDFIWYMYMY